MVKLDPQNEILKIGQTYFNYLATNYPVMCLSDEFYFFPRAKEKGLWPDEFAHDCHRKKVLGLRPKTNNSPFVNLFRPGQIYS